MITLKAIRQRPSLCAPASLAMVLSFYGIHQSQVQLAILCKTTRRDGTTFANLVRGAKKFALNVSAQENASIKELRGWITKGLPVIVNWFSVDEGHYSVAVAINQKTITLLDPEVGQRRQLPIQKFLRLWFGLRHEPIRTVADIALRRMLVLRPTISSKV